MPDTEICRKKRKEAKNQDRRRSSGLLFSSTSALSPSLPPFRIVSPLDDPRWDAAIARLPNATFFHTAAWARVLKNAYGFRIPYFVTGEPGRYRTVLPMAEVDSWLTGRRGVALPFSDVCGPLTTDPESLARIVQALAETGAQRCWKYWEVRGGRSLFPEAPASVSFWGHSLSLNSDPSTLFTRFDSATRRAVRKAEKSQLTIEFSREPKDVGNFHDLLCLTRRRHGLPPQPFRFFETIQREVLDKNLGIVVLARLSQGGALPGSCRGDEAVNDIAASSARTPPPDVVGYAGAEQPGSQIPTRSQSGRAVAGAIFFEFSGQALYKFGASDEAFQHLRGNNLVMWHAISHYARRGFASLDFGRTSLGNAGLRQFKLGWGTSESTLDYVRYDLRQQRYVTTPDLASGWHTRFFQKMPAFASRLLGEVLYRHMA